MTEVSFGEWLKRQRMGRGLTREQLAHQIGCAVVTLRKIESEERRPSPQMVEQIADILNISQSERTSFLKYARGDWTKSPSERVVETPWNIPVSISKPRNNLPAQLTTFIGREKEIREVKEAVNTHRLVTLTGAGGTGKTRLSLQVAQELLREFDYTWFVELAPLTDPDDIPQTILSTIGLSEQRGRTTQEIVSDYLQDKSTLIVLDNCEHLIEASAKIVHVLLTRAPELKILASSREALGVRGEMIWHVPSLSLPDIQHLPEYPEFIQYESIRLFTERARLVQPGFTATKENASLIAQICSRLDGIPLALELAAARLKALSVEQIAARLDDRFQLLTGGSRIALPRQQTLRATIDWSYNLLTEPERALLRRLTVFSGGWTLEAAESVCSKERSGFDVLDLLTQLVDKSLVNLQESRYHMLETTRQYAREKLLDSDEDAFISEKHLEYFLDLAEKADKEIRGPDQLAWINKIEIEYDNFRAALHWCASNQKTEFALRLLTRLSEAWLRRDHLYEMRNWFNTIRLLPGIKDFPILYASLLNYVSQHSWLLGDFDYARSLLEESQSILMKLGVEGEPDLAKNLHWQGMVVHSNEGDNKAAQSFFERSLELYQKHGNQWGMACVLFNLGFLAGERNDDGVALSLFKQSTDLFQQLGDQWGMARVSQLLGQSYLKQGNYEKARVHFDEHLKIDEGLRFKQGTMVALQNLGNLCRYQGDYDQATRFYEKTLIMSREYEDRWDLSNSLWYLGLVGLQRNDYQQAWQQFIDSYNLARAIYGGRISECDFLTGMAAVAAGTNQPERAAKLYGAAQALFETTDYRIQPFDQAEFDRHIRIAEEELGGTKFEELVSEGYTMTMEQAIAYALEDQGK